MPARTRLKWLAGALGALAVIAALLAGAALTGGAILERRAVERDIRLNQAGGLTPEERVALAGRLRAAADRPGLAPGERARRLDAAGLAYFWAGRADEAKPLFRAEYDLIRDTAGSGEVINVLNCVNNCTPAPQTAAELDELRQTHATIRALGARLPPGGTAALIVDMSPAQFAGCIERFVTRPGVPLNPAERRALLDEAVALREQAAGRPGQADDAIALFRLAETLELRGDSVRAATLFERVAELPGTEEGQPEAFMRLLKLRHPDRADPSRIAAVRGWLAGRPVGEGTGVAEQDLAFCLLELKQYPEAEAVFRRLANREGAKRPPDRGLLSYHLWMCALAQDGAGRGAVADALKRRLIAEFSDTPCGRLAARIAR